MPNFFKSNLIFWDVSLREGSSRTPFPAKSAGKKKFPAEIALRRNENSNWRAPKKHPHYTPPTSAPQMYCSNNAMKLQWQNLLWRKSTFEDQTRGDNPGIQKGRNWMRRSFPSVGPRQKYNTFTVHKFKFKVWKVLLFPSILQKLFLLRIW